MLLDLHVHQSRHSLDSRLDILDAVRDAKKHKLGGICITDHDDLGLRAFAEALSVKENLLIIVGVEINTLDGDLLCYGIDEMPKVRMSAQETIDFVHKGNGVVIAAHPYRHNNRGLKDVLFDVNGLDAIEAYNGRTDDQSNLLALEAAKTLNIPVTGASDAHTVGEIGNYVTYFEDTIRNENDFINAIKSKKFKPVSLMGRTIIDITA